MMGQIWQYCTEKLFVYNLLTSRFVYNSIQVLYANFWEHKYFMHWIGEWNTLSNPDSEEVECGFQMLMCSYTIPDHKF